METTDLSQALQNLEDACTALNTAVKERRRHRPISIQLTVLTERAGHLAESAAYHRRQDDYEESFR